MEVEIRELPQGGSLVEISGHEVDLLEKEAQARGITIQELVCMLLKDWLEAQR